MKESGFLRKLNMAYNTPTVTELETQSVLRLWDKFSKENVRIYASVRILNKEYNDFLTELGLGITCTQTPHIIRYPVLVDKKKWFLNKIKYGI
jgi:hypothetical protein